MLRVALRVPVPSLMLATLVHLSGLEQQRQASRLGQVPGQVLGQVLGQLLLVMWQHWETWVEVGTVRSLWPSWTQGRGTQLSGSSTWPTLSA